MSEPTPEVLSDADRLILLETKVQEMVDRFDSIETRIADAWEKIQPLLSEIAPILAKLEASPMFKMLTAGSKGKK